MDNPSAVPADIKELLDSEAARINRPEFIASDPVQFPHRFESLQDIEISSLIAAVMAWGNRKMICRDIERMLSLMDNQPHRYVMERGYEDLDPDMNLHRTLFGGHMQHFMRGLHDIYRKHGSLDAFAAASGAAASGAPAWHLAASMQNVMTAANDGQTCSRCLPLHLGDTALKRLNMALRWLVRDDGIVDLGVWRSIPKSKLFIPLDVHVANVSRQLGLLTRRANDRKSVVQLTDVLRTLNPGDPTVYDFALFGIGVGN